jgi:lipopolysaccharide export system protein LptA
MISDKKKNTFLATRKPLMIIKQEKDSLYVTADTLMSARLIDRLAALRKLAIMDSLHKRYVDSLYKASADSLHRRATDSINARDTLNVSSPDSTHPMIVKVRGDSLVVRPDSLTTRDTLSRKPVPDSLSQPPHQPSDTSATIHPSDTSAIIHPSDTSAAAHPPKAIPGHKRLLAGDRPGIKLPAGEPSRPGDTTRPGLPGRPDSTQPKAPIQAANVSDPDHEKYTDTARAPITDSSLRYILAFHHVRIYSDSLQAVADSMYYSGQDSIFRLFYNPVAWGSGNYQITGDTMYVYTKNKKANRLYVFENAIAVNKVGSKFYNQIKGTTINAYFKNGQVDYMRAKGNAESIYYVQDDNKAYTGVNKAHADIIDMVFGEKTDSGRELKKVIMRNDVEGSMIPFKKVNFDDMVLRGFKWLEARRPKSKEELFE